MLTEDDVDKLWSAVLHKRPQSISQLQSVCSDELSVEVCLKQYIIQTNILYCCVQT